MADRGHELTDEKIKKMEEELRKEYTQAAAEIENKLKDYMDRFTKKDAIWQKWVKEGKKTPEEYANWRTGQMAVGKRWEKMKDSIADDLLHVNDIATGIVTGQMPEIFATNANYAIYSAESDAGIDTGLTLYNRDAVNTIIQDEPDLLLPPGRKVSAEIAAGTAKRWEREKIQSVMLQGILQGESIPNIARRLAEKVADSNFKAAVRNARTMSTNAQNLGRYHAYERLEKRGVGVTLEWAATLDNRTRHEHRMMHGQRRNVGEPFDVEGIKIMYPAQTGKFMGVSDIPQRMIWNCFTGDNIVDSDSQIIKSYKHIYSGELITIETASGINFTCTPNHPILTRFGWIPAAKLHKGDDLLVTSAVDNGSAGRDRNINHVHSSFEALHESLSNFGSVNQHPMTNFNFHGDVPASDVEIVSQERLLRGCIDTGISQGFYKTILKNTNSLVFCKRHLMAGFRRIYISALRFVSRRRKALSLFWRGVCHADVHGLGTVTNRDVVLPEYAINNLPAETVIRSQLLNGLAGHVSVDNIISIHKRSSTCHVYNLQTENGYYFVGSSINQNGEKSNGNYIIAKNCRCTILAYVKGYEHDTIKKSDKMGDMTFDEWLKAKEQPEPILKQKEKGDAISGAFNRQYAGRPVGPARPLGKEITQNTKAPDKEVVKSTSTENERGRKILEGVYENHRTSNNMTSVPLEELKQQEQKFNVPRTVDVNYGKMSPDAADAWNSALEELTRDFDTPLTRVRTMTRDEFMRNPRAFAYVDHDYTVDTAEMVINPTKCKDLEALSNRIKELSDNGYAVKIDPENAGKYVATHEFAHTLLHMMDPIKNKTNFVNANYDNIRAARKEIEDIYKRYSDEVGKLTEKTKKYELDTLLAPNVEEAEKAQKLYLEADAELSKIKLSDYSLADSDEFMAESFTEQRIGEAKNPYAKEVMDVLIRHFGRK